jgi:hypothetical protein
MVRNSVAYVNSKRSICPQVSMSTHFGLTYNTRLRGRSCQDAVIDLSLVCKIIFQEVMAQRYLYIPKLHPFYP